MSFSLNEADVTAKKAARGAGYEWGLAEEAGKAVRWLCRNGLHGCSAMAELVQAAPTMACPLAAGLSMSDFPERLREGEIQFEMLDAPLMVLPFAALAAQHLETTVTVHINERAFVTDGHRVSSAPAPSSDRVLVRLGGHMENPLPEYSRAEPNETAWSILANSAHKTYAPATEESRKLGAGAGESDND
ncbi:MAG: DUF3726 domain-containing protein [Paracoccaceae bacterium]